MLLTRSLLGLHYLYAPMSFWKIFKKSSTTSKVGNTEDFMTLIRVYLQAAMAEKFGLRDFRAMPDLQTFKRSFKIPTTANRVGTNEKKYCQQMMQNLYGLDAAFFQEIDASIKKRCHTMQDMQAYFFQFQGFAQELLLLMSSIMSWKLRIPSFFKSTIKRMIAQSIHAVMHQNDWKDASVVQAVGKTRSYVKQLNFSENWISEFVFQIVLLARKEPKQQAE